MWRVEPGCGLGEGWTRHVSVAAFGVTHVCKCRASCEWECDHSRRSGSTRRPTHRAKIKSRVQVSVPAARSSCTWESPARRATQNGDGLSGHLHCARVHHCVGRSWHKLGIKLVEGSAAGLGPRYAARYTSGSHRLSLCGDTSLDGAVREAAILAVQVRWGSTGRALLHGLTARTDGLFLVFIPPSACKTSGEEYSSRLRAAVSKTRGCQRVRKSTVVDTPGLLLLGGKRIGCN